MAKYCRYVNIRDQKLEILSTCCWLIYTGIFVGLTFYFGFWYSALAIDHNMFLNVYSRVGDIENFRDLQDGWNEGLQHPACLFPWLYSFWFDAEGKEAFRDFSCATLCDDGVLKDGCISRHQIIKTPAPKELTIVSYIEDTLYGISGNSTDMIQKKVLPWNPNTTNVNLEYFIREQGDGFFSSLGIGGEKPKIFSSSKDIITVIRDPKGAIVRTLGPGVVEMTVEELLRLSVEISTNSIDSPEMGDDTNLRPSAHHSRGPIPRLNGADIGIQVTCHNFLLSDEKSLWKRYGEYPVCSIRVSYFGGNLVGYNEKVIVDANGQVANRISRGVRISMQAYGEFHFFSAFSLLLALAFYMLFSAVPKAFMRFLVSNMLGSYSNIYSRAITSNFNIYDYSRGLLARLMLAYLCFDQFAAKDKDSLPKEVLASRLANSIVHYDIMKERKGEPRESGSSGRSMDAAPSQEDKMGKLKALVDLSYHAFLSDAAPSACMQKLRAVWKPGCNLDWESSDSGIDRQHFMDGILDNEILKFEDLAQLFDSERKPGFMEKAFANYKIAQFKQYAKATQPNLGKEQPSIYHYFRRCFSDHNHEAASMVLSDDVWNIPRMRVEKLTGRLHKLERQVAALRDVKPPIVITLPKTPSAENKEVIAVELDTTTGNNLGFEIVEITDDSGLQIAEIAAINSVGCLPDWNKENADAEISVGDRIYILNDYAKQFDAVKEELARKDLHYILFEKSLEGVKRQKLNSNFAPDMCPGEYGESKEEELSRKEDAARKLEYDLKDNESELKAIDFATPIAEADSLISQFNELGVMLDFDHNEFGIFRSRIYHSQACYKCGTTKVKDNVCVACGFDVSTPPVEQTLELKKDDRRVLFLEFRTVQQPHEAEPLEAIIEIPEENEKIEETEVRPLVATVAPALTAAPEQRKPKKPTFDDYEAQYFDRLYGKSLLDPPGHSRV